MTQNGDNGIRTYVSSVRASGPKLGPILGGNSSPYAASLCQPKFPWHSFALGLWISLEQFLAHNY